MSIKTISLLLLVFIVFVFVSCILPPLRHKSVSHDTKSRLREQYENINDNLTEYIRIIDDNKAALLWRLRMIEYAQKEIVFSTFDYRMDNSGLDILCALYQASKRGVKARLIADGLDSYFSIKFNPSFQMFATLPNITVKLYNPLNIFTPLLIFKNSNTTD